MGCEQTVLTWDALIGGFGHVSPFVRGRATSVIRGPPVVDLAVLLGKHHTVVNSRNVLFCGFIFCEPSPPSIRQESQAPREIRFGLKNRLLFLLCFGCYQEHTPISALSDPLDPLRSTTSSCAAAQA